MLQQTMEIQIRLTEHSYQELRCFPANLHHLVSHGYYFRGVPVFRFFTFNFQISRRYLTKMDLSSMSLGFLLKNKKCVHWTRMPPPSALSKMAPYLMYCRYVIWIKHSVSYHRKRIPCNIPGDTVRKQVTFQTM